MLKIDNQLKFSEYKNLYDVVVPKEHILRKINETIDFSFVNEMLRESYCEHFGRPAKEPEMMFKILFLKRMYDLSDQLLVDELGYNMAFKFFIGLDPEDKAINSSLLTKFRKTRITEDILEDMLSETLKQAIGKSLIKSRAIIVDSTHSYSKGNYETPTQILRRMSKALRREIYNTQIDLAKYFPEKPVETDAIDDEIEYTKKLISVLEGKLKYKNSEKLLSKIQDLLNDDRIKSIQSMSDEEASTGHKSIDNSFFGYKSHLAMTEERLITGIEVSTGKASDAKLMTDLVEQSKKNGISVEEVIGDMAYSSKENIDYCNEKNIKLISKLNPIITNGNSRDVEFVYNKDAGAMQCPEGHLAIRCDIRKGRYDNQYYVYYFSLRKCKKCVRCGNCYQPGAKVKTHSITVTGETRGNQQEFEQTEYFKNRIKQCILQYKNITNISIKV